MSGQVAAGCPPRHSGAGRGAGGFPAELGPAGRQGSLGCAPEREAASWDCSQVRVPRPSRWTRWPVDRASATDGGSRVDSGRGHAPRLQARSLAPAGVRVGGNQPMRLSHPRLSLPALPLSTRDILGEDEHPQRCTWRGHPPKPVGEAFSPTRQCGTPCVCFPSQPHGPVRVGAAATQTRRCARPGRRRAVVCGS